MLFRQLARSIAERAFQAKMIQPMRERLAIDAEIELCGIGDGTETGMSSLVIRLSTLHPIFASVR